MPLTSDYSSEMALLAADTLAMRPTRGIATWMLHVMDQTFIESFSGHPPGSYRSDPDAIYLDFQRKAGACFIDQYLADNPLTMANEGYQAEAERGASTGAKEVVLDGIRIDSPEAVVEHLERVVFPRLEAEVATFDGDEPTAIEAMLAEERRVQRMFGPSILKVPYGEAFQSFPCLRYTTYGYVEYLTAAVMYPEVLERDFRLQADLAVQLNTRSARAIVEGGLPKVLRLDHDMADSRGTLLDVRKLDRMWFPHFARAIQPFIDAGILTIWHCDGNLMAMIPRLLEVGIAGFQGFQYEDGMDYARICRMRTREGHPLMIWAGVSVTRTLPFGTREDVRRELTWLVEEGPRVGLVLGASSSITPGVPHRNLEALIEGLAHYRAHGR